MMLAKAKDFNILDNHQLIVSLMKDCVIDDITNIFLVPFCEK
jgi:hypothetical protein